MESCTRSDIPGDRNIHDIAAKIVRFTNDPKKLRLDVNKIQRLYPQNSQELTEKLRELEQIHRQFKVRFEVPLKLNNPNAGISKRWD